MKKQKNKISTEDLRDVAAIEEAVDEFYINLEKSRKFKIDDYLVCYKGRVDDVKLELNYYGTPVKYKVAHVDKHGISWAYQIDVNGNPIYNLFCLFNFSRPDVWGDDDQYVFEYRLDPEFVDSILLENKDAYDPGRDHKAKSKLRKEILEYNKSIRMPTFSIDTVIETVDSMQVGEVYWCGPKSFFRVEKKEEIPLDSALKRSYYFSRSVKSIQQISVVYGNGKKNTLTPLSIMHKNIYKSQPRKFIEIQKHI